MYQQKHSKFKPNLHTKYNKFHNFQLQSTVTPIRRSAFWITCLFIYLAPVEMEQKKNNEKNKNWGSDSYSLTSPAMYHSTPFVNVTRTAQKMFFVRQSPLWRPRGNLIDVFFLSNSIEIGGWISETGSLLSYRLNYLASVELCCH